MGRQVEVVAHRGASAEEPEHSLAAYLRALEQGADAIECDVRLTADGTLVLVHDRRVDRTSSGRGPVSAHTLGELSSYDFSGRREPGSADDSRARLLTLPRLLATMLDASSTVRFAIETKHPTRFGGYVEQSVVEVLRYFGLTSGAGLGRVRVMSFSRAAVRRVHEHAPSLETVLLLDRVPKRLRDGRLPMGVPIVGPSIESIRRHPRYVERVHGHGGRVHVWTVDEKADVTLCRDLGVDAIITNRPARVLELLGR